MPSTRRQTSYPSDLCRFLFVCATCLALPGCSETDPPTARFTRQIEWVGQGEWLKIDTHIHTRFSDGAYTVSEVAAKATEFGCDLIAITDHADRERRAATPEYLEAIEVARRQHPQLMILAGLEWNIPPWGGDAHATILIPPGPDELFQLADFKERFDDHGRETHEAARGDDGLRWLETLPKQEHGRPLVLFNHPSRRQTNTRETADQIQEWRSINDMVVGMSGAPGHQAGQPIGDYEEFEGTIDRWDPAVARVGDAWDTLLGRGLDIWAARAASDFHKDTGTNFRDYWPGEFSETWVYAPARTPEGVLRALRAGSAFAAHGHIAREVDLTVMADGLERPAHVGEAIEAPVGSTLSIALDFTIPLRNWSDNPNHIDQIELITVTAAESRVVSERAPGNLAPQFTETLTVPEGGLVIRARGRRIVADGPDLLFYTNPIRITAIVPQPPAFVDWKALPVRQIIGIGILGLATISLVTLGVRSVWPTKSRRSSSRESSRRESYDRESSQSHRSSLSGVGTIRPSMPRRLHFAGFSIGFAAFVAYGSWVPFEMTSVSLEEGWKQFGDLMLLGAPGGTGRTDFYTNLVLFVPMGFALLGTFRIDARPSQTASAMAVCVVMLLSMLISLIVEAGQIWLPSRVPSRFDVLAQSGGTIIGLTLWFICGQRFVNWLRLFTSGNRQTHPVDWLLQSYFAMLILISVVPLDLTIHPIDLYTKFQQGKINLVPFSNFVFDRDGLLELFFHGILFVPVGALCTRWFLPIGSSLRTIGGSTIFGMLLVLAIECVQLLVFSRFTTATDLVTGGAGVFLGAVLVHLAFAPTHPDQSVETPQFSLLPVFGWLAAALLYAIIPCIFFWAPFEVADNSDLIRERWNGFFVIPFSRLHRLTYLKAYTQIVREVLLFAPLGFALGNAALRVPGSPIVRKLMLTLACGGIAGAALVIELGQIFLPDRTADITDFLLATIGGMAGLFLTIQVYAFRQTPNPVTGNVNFVLVRPNERDMQADGPSIKVAKPLQYAPGVDGLRACACLAVFGVHFQQITDVGGKVGFLDWKQLLINGNTGVAYFFVLSGFLLSLPLWRKPPEIRAATTLRGFMRRRLFRILPAYYICLTALVLAGQHWHSGGEILDTALHYLFLHTLTNSTFYSISSPFWTMAIIAQFYVLFGISLRLFTRRKMLTDRFLLGLLLGLTVGTYGIHCGLMYFASAEASGPGRFLDANGPALSHSIIAHLPLFTLGMLAGHAYINRQNLVQFLGRHSRWFFELSFWLAAIMIIVILGTPIDEWCRLPYARYHFPFVPSLLIWLIIAVPQTRVALAVLESWPCKRLGIISYGVYVFHLPCLKVLERAFAKADLTPQQSPLAFGAGGLALSILIAAASYLLLERRLLAYTRTNTPRSANQFASDATKASNS